MQNQFKRTLINELNSGIHTRIMPGLAASISYEGGSEDFYLGSRDIDCANNVSQDTYFDLASLTKVLSTTILTAQAISEGYITMAEEPWPQWPGVTVRHILSHSSGLKAWAPLYLSAFQANRIGHHSAKKMVIKEALSQRLQAPPGEQTEYSDVGFIVLGDLLERRLGDRIEGLFKRRVLPLFSTQELFFINSCASEKLNFLFAPTKNCAFSLDPARPQINDANAYAMGGPAGHAGLFGTLNGVKSAVNWVQLALTKGCDSLSRTLQHFANVRSPRPLGFDFPTTGGSTGGALSRNSVGHLGFTGTSFWIDLGSVSHPSATYILLTNRVYEDSTPFQINQFRQRFHLAGSSFVKNCLPNQSR